jgi:hypothetical protein
MTINEMQIKTTLRVNLTPVGMARTQTATNVDKDVGKRNPHTLLVGM